MTEQMRAMVIHRVGGPDAFELAMLPLPKPGAGEVLIRLAYAGVNPADWKDREGYLSQFYTYEFPYVLGMDGAGVVAEVGAGVDQFRVGDRVVTCSDHGQGKPGTYAEYVVASTAKVALLPDSIGFADAGGIPVAALTAWQTVCRRPGPIEGKTVLIHGASGGVGGYAVQFAKLANATVLATCSGPKMDYVKGLGADTVIDYKATDIEQSVRSQFAGGVDVIIDAVGCDTLPGALSLLCSGGVLVNIATLVGDGDIEGDMRRAHEMGVAKVFAIMDDTTAANDLADIVRLIDQGKVKLPPRSEFELTEVGDAHQAVQEGRVHGKAVLRIAVL